MWIKTLRNLVCMRPLAYNASSPSVWVSTILRQVIDSPNIKMTSQYKYASLKAMEGISCTRPVCMSILLAPDQQLSHHGHRVSRYLPLCMLDYVTQDQHTCLKPSSFFLSSFMRLAGLLQLLNSGHFVTFVWGHLACRLQLHYTSIHVS